MFILTYFQQKSGPGNTLPTPALLLSLTAITDHPRVGEVKSGYGPQSGAVPVKILNSFWYWAVQSVRVAGSWLGRLSHSF
jgi:hypothetical protein